jgi:hypothetical protein
MSFTIIHDHHTSTMSTYNTENKQNFFCINKACRNTANYGHLCMPCYLPPPPRHTSLESMRDEIAEIEARLLTKMTKKQKDDWIWILHKRREDLAEAEKDLWAQYDKDDLRKMDQANRRGF